jgi:outer membrane immunogenic protein
LATLVAASPALAQSTVTAPVGGRVEAIVGYDVLKVPGDKDEGVVYGIGAGFDFAATPALSLGVDLEAAKSTVKESDGFASVEAGRDLYAGGRVTLPISSNANVYAKAGYTNARFKAQLGSLRESENLDGYRLGAGAQFGVGGKAYVGGEYRYSNYEQDLARHQVVATLGTRF